MTNDKVESLENYLKTGRLIRKYPPNELLEMEDIIKNGQSNEFFKSLSECISYKEFGNNYYLALVAPSLTGKTQSAFTIKSKKPVYFSLGAFQNIYNCFSMLNKELEKSAIEDHDRFMEIFNETTKTLPSQSISMTILDDFIGSKSRTLGLLFALMKDGLENYVEPTDEDDIKKDWMFFYTRERTIEYTPMSMADFLKHPNYQDFKDNFYVFLDEFVVVGRPWRIFIRNLCRKLKLTCAVASTDADWTDSIGASLKSGSRTELPRLRTICKTEVFPMTKGQVESEEELPDLITKLHSLAANISEEELSKVKLFTDYLLEQCVDSRPGFMYLCIDALLKCVNGDFFNREKITMDELFESFMGRLQFEVYQRKKIDLDTIEGIHAKCQLMCGNYFKKDYYEGQNDELVFDTGNIDNHFFYIKSPVENLTFPLMRAATSQIPIIPNYFKKRAVFEVQSYFKLEEELFLIACLMNNLKYSIAVPFFSIYHKSIALEQDPEPKSLYENLAATAIIDTSSKSLTGTRFEDFLKGVVNSFNRTVCDKKKRRFEIKTEPKIQATLAKFKVPFLYPSNTDWPDVYEKFLPRNSSKILRGNYSKTSIQSRIDAKFDLVNAENNNWSQCIVKCKNRGDNFDVNEFANVIDAKNKFLEKNNENNSKYPIHLTFCKSLGEFKSRNKYGKAVISKAQQEKMNVLRLEPVYESEFNFSHFKLVPWCSKHLPFYQEPEITAIIIDVNSLFKAFHYL